MQITQEIWRLSDGWQTASHGQLDGEADLVLAFADRRLLQATASSELLAQRYPGAEHVICSSAGEISSTQLLEETLVATAIRFEKSRVSTAIVEFSPGDNSREVGSRLAGAIEPEGLRNVLVFSDGLQVNGSLLSQGLNATLPDGVLVTGGLSGDSDLFERTLVGLNAEPRPNAVVAVGFYGEHLQLGHGSMGGWDPFGPDRLVTRARGNRLYELDGRNALELYCSYLGEYSEQLPASGLLFPLLVHEGARREGVVRTLLGIDEKEQCLVFAGDMNEGSYARLMKANLERLIEGARQSAAQTLQRNIQPQLALLVSCVGRKMVLGQRTEEELEAVSEGLGDQALLCGFYSYGELVPPLPGSGTELHNQTMTITTLSES